MLAGALSRLKAYLSRHNWMAYSLSVAGIAMAIFLASEIHNLIESANARPAFRNACEENAFKRYVELEGEAAEKSPLIPSIEQGTAEIVHGRRLMESFCSSFVACTSRPNETIWDSFHESDRLEQCLINEQRYNDEEKKQDN